MKSILQNQFLSIAIAISMLLHGIFLSVNFIAPKLFQFSSDSQKLDIVLVNTKHDRAPLNPDALAQANLDGGDKSSHERTQSPIPDMKRHSDGSHLLAAENKVAATRKVQTKLMAQLLKRDLLNTPLPIKPKARKAQPNKAGASDISESADAFARKAAEMALKVQDNQKAPKKSYISPSTREVPIALYYDSLRKRIEQIGELNYPQANGRKLHGELIISIPIFHDGSIYEADGGPVIKQSSGNQALDAAAIRTVRRAAPFGKFPPDMRAKYSDLWVLTVRLEFTRDNTRVSR